MRDTERQTEKEGDIEERESVCLCKCEAWKNLS